MVADRVGFDERRGLTFIRRAPDTPPMQPDELTRCLYCGMPPALCLNGKWCGLACGSCHILPERKVAQ